MIGQLRLIGMGVALAIATVQPVPAQERGEVVLWDQHIATAMNQMLLSDRACQRNPYQNIGRSCVENEINLSLDGGPRVRTTLDELVLFVDDARNVDVDRELDQRTKVKFNAKVATLTHNEAEVRFSVGIQF